MYKSVFLGVNAANADTRKIRKIFIYVCVIMDEGLSSYMGGL